VKVTLVDGQYWAEVVNFGHSKVRIPDRYVREFDRLLTGGIWAQVEMKFEYDEDTGGKYPFWIEKLTPIQLATFDLAEYRALRKEFTTEEWTDLIVRSMGYEPTEMDERLKLLFITRLIPLCERNFNLVELGPRGTGKSYAVQEISPYAALLTGPTTVANLFGHMSGKHKGMVQIWDAVGFDEVADLQNMPKEVITTMKTYCESGQFQRGKESMAGYASIAMFGNTQQPVDVMVQTGSPLRADARHHPRRHGVHRPAALLPARVGSAEDAERALHRPLRLRGGLPGRGAPRPAEAELHRGHRPLLLAGRAPERPRPEGRASHGVGADQDPAPRRAGVEGGPGADRGAGVEGRRRVKEQLKKMGSFEYYQTSFSYLDNDTGEEHYVGVPEQGGQNLISQEPLAPGTLYTGAVSGDGHRGPLPLEVTPPAGSGKLKLAGG
jgi:ATP-dependent Lon protease